MSTEAFQFPEGYWQDLKHQMVDRSMRDYLQTFEANRDIRPGRAFATADVEEFMRLGEMFFQLVHKSQIKFLRNLDRRHPDYFTDDSQRARLMTYADNHEARNRASKKDDLVKDILEFRQ
jgi:hypothetical protein